MDQDYITDFMDPLIQQRPHDHKPLPTIPPIPSGGSNLSKRQIITLSVVLPVGSLCVAVLIFSIYRMHKQEQSERTEIIVKKNRWNFIPMLRLKGRRRENVLRNRCTIPIVDVGLPNIQQVNGDYLGADSRDKCDAIDNKIKYNMNQYLHTIMALMKEGSYSGLNDENRLLINCMRGIIEVSGAENLVLIRMLVKQNILAIINKCSERLERNVTERQIENIKNFLNSLQDFNDLLSDLIPVELKQNIKDLVQKCSNKNPLKTKRSAPILQTFATSITSCNNPFNDTAEERAVELQRKEEELENLHRELQRRDKTIEMLEANKKIQVIADEYRSRASAINDVRLVIPARITECINLMDLDGAAYEFLEKMRDLLSKVAELEGGELKKMYIKQIKVSFANPLLLIFRHKDFDYLIPTLDQRRNIALKTGIGAKKMDERVRCAKDAMSLANKLRRIFLLAGEIKTLDAVEVKLLDDNVTLKVWVRYYTRVSQSNLYSRYSSIEDIDELLGQLVNKFPELSGESGAQSSILTIESNNSKTPRRVVALMSVVDDIINNSFVSVDTKGDK